MNRLGERIKKRRTQLKVHLNDLASQVGVSASALSQIENAKAFPSILTLKKIADNLHITVGEIIGEHEALSNNPVIRSEERKFVKENRSGARLYLLSNHDQGKQMETYLITLAEKAETGSMMKVHHGQEFLFILSGTVEVIMDEISYQLKKGDSFYLNSNISHSIVNKSKGKSEIIWIVTPPNI